MPILDPILPPRKVGRKQRTMLGLFHRDDQISAIQIFLKTVLRIAQWIWMRNIPS